MMSYLRDALLCEFFTDDAILGHNYDRTQLFYILADLFCIPRIEAEELFAWTESEVVRDIVTLEDFKRHLRIRQYHKLVGYAAYCSEEEERLIAIKGNALRSVEKSSIQNYHQSADTMLVQAIMRCAGNGSVLALRMLGVLQCEGVLVGRNEVSGIENLTKAARWGNVPAILALFRYSGCSRSELMSMLVAAVSNTPFDGIQTVLEKKYNTPSAVKAHPELALLRRSICAHHLDPDTYDPGYARVAFSGMIGMRNKEQILFSEGSGLVSEVCSLPLKLVFGSIKIDPETVDRLLPKRPGETEGLLHGLETAEMRALDSFRPMCICSDSDYVLETYARAISQAVCDAHVERIEMNELRELDFEPTKNHVFLRGLSENRTNILLLMFRGEVDEDTVRLAADVLRTTRRRNFRLLNPAVSLDLSPVLPVCICDRENAEKIRKDVDILEIAPLRNEEKPDVIRDMLDSKKETFMLKAVEATGEAIDLLASIPVEKAGQILDKVLLSHRKAGESFRLDADLIHPFLNSPKGRNHTYGFGGC